MLAAWPLLAEKYSRFWCHPRLQGPLQLRAGRKHWCCPVHRPACWPPLSHCHANEVLITISGGVQEPCPPSDDEAPAAKKPRGGDVGTWQQQQSKASANQLRQQAQQQQQAAAARRLLRDPSVVEMQQYWKWSHLVPVKVTAVFVCCGLTQSYCLEGGPPGACQGLKDTWLHRDRLYRQWSHLRRVKMGAVVELLAAAGRIHSVCRTEPPRVFHRGWIGGPSCCLLAASILLLARRWQQRCSCHRILQRRRTCMSCMACSATGSSLSWLCRWLLDAISCWICTTS